MTGFILGEKGKQSQMFTTDAQRQPVTFIKTTPCYLVEIKKPEKSGYFSVKLGFGTIKNQSKPTLGELKKAGIKTPLHFLREFRLPVSIKTTTDKEKVGLVIDDKTIFVGDEIKSNLFFKVDDLVRVSGTSKGKGFQGVVKRHHFKGGSRTHGQSHGERAPGSIGSTTTPGRINKGKRMAGRMGNERISIDNLKVVEVREDGLLVKGLVPGAVKGLVEIRNL
jgi:large subunit ribosomal protein L3